MQNLIEYLESLRHDGERYAEILKIEKELDSLKKSIRKNVERSFRDHKTLKVVSRKVWKVDPASPYGQDIKNLKTAIKELEAQAKEVGAGHYEESLSIGLATEKSPKVPNDLDKGGSTVEGGIYKEFFF